MAWCAWWVVAGCVRSQSVECGDGVVCATGKVCDPVHGLCVTEAQTTACAALAEADRCTADEFAGLCDQGVCLAGCGDGVQDAEECDDGNLASHDGCSSQCTLERAAWAPWQSAWTSRARHAAAYLAATQTLVVFGGTDDVGASDAQWERGPDGTWTQRTIPRPSPRVGAAMVYDELNQRIVLFGGSPDLVTATSRGLGDTWTYDGTTWTPLTSTPAPAPRWGANMAYAGNGRLVLFGGRSVPAPACSTPPCDEWHTDTWELTGSTWKQITSTPRPPGRFHAGITWAPFAVDPRVVMFGGSGDNGGGFGILADTWEYRREELAGAGWTLRARVAASDPPVLQAPAVAFDASSAKVVMFGGVGPLLPLSATWMFDDAGWTTYASTAPPPGRTNSTLTALPDRLVLIAGRGATATLDDAWEFRPSPGSGPAPIWQLAAVPTRAEVRGEVELVFHEGLQRTIALGGLRNTTTDEVYEYDSETWRAGPRLPESRSRFTAAYDALRDRIVLFGGISGAAAIAGTRTYSAADGWASHVGAEPSIRRNGAMAFDRSRGQIVLFGGLGTDGVPRSDTWTFDTAWTQLAFDTPTAASNRAAMAYDPTGTRMVMFDERGVTWRLSPGGWTQLTASGPPARSAAAMIYSPELSAVVLYGGVASGALLSDMWMLVGDAWVEVPVEGVLPPPRQDPDLAAHRPLRALLLHAGTAASGRRLDDTWLFQYRSEVPDEVCGNGQDDDQDRRVDALDPDCD